MPASTNAGLPLEWVSPAGERTPSGRVRYRGSLAAADRPLSLHLGFDGSEPPFLDVAMEREEDGSWTAEVPDTDGHILLDCAVSTAEDDWDNNGGADFRLWIGLDPVDAHVHARTRGSDSMGFQSLRTALASGGMTHALVSWQDNAFIDEVTAGVPWLTRLVWVSPGGPGPDDVRRRLSGGAVGLKLHPTYDEYPADAPGLDPFLQAAADAGVPVAVHTAPGPSDPDLVRRLAERFPQVPFVLYHTFLGPEEGRRRAARHAQQLPNLHLETSWCRSAEVRRLIDEVGAERVLFGSDAATDGPVHFVRSPPNIEMTENYNESLLVLARQLPAPTLRALLQDNTRRLFGLAGPRPGEEPTPTADVHQLFVDALQQAERVVGRVGRDQFPLSTPCTEWDVQALLGHLLATVRRAERVAGGRSVESVPQVAAVDPRGGWASRFRAATAKARHAWDAAAPADVVAPWGMLPGPVGLSGFVLELVVHTHDLALSTDYPDPLDQRLATAALRITERLLPTTLRGTGSAFAAPQAVPDGADAYARLSAFLGRAPR
ncbi:uncharacterized protein (TIGR03086 family) [Geodermatophilus tzadiensis]|uniref:Uncharacterized protein (TIGR03086 family) n=1 Tax=Geodermatophilus tzadiensis TaxID=1137988 RepID=A0A2T0TVC5_9ACTN|nr:TIGR03086 family metal-binding protein [Geodermatophilus tzadiensis]PRY49600.1 uncharacterized protein (TIGR03086 family) [Geodermatophilus tzadiensis]